MTTQVIFKIDPRIKRAAIRRAKHEGTTFSGFLKFATQSYVDGNLSVGLMRVGEIPNAKTARALDEADRDIEMGRNLSPAFHNAKDMIAYLKRETGRR